MRTDAQLLRLFQLAPEKILRPLGLDPSLKYRGESITLKQFQRQTDMAFLPESPGAPTCFVEFQAQRDDSIYNRICMAMCSYSYRQGSKSHVIGAIVFIKRSVNSRRNVKDHWSYGAEGLKVLYLDEMVASWRAEDPNSVIAAVFQPLLRESLQTPCDEELVNAWRIIKQAPYSPHEVSDLEDIFFAWLVERFPNKNYQEVRNMFAGLTPLEETKAWKQFGQLNREEGRQEGRLEGRLEGRQEGRQEGREEQRRQIQAALEQLGKEKNLPPEILQELKTRFQLTD